MRLFEARGLTIEGSRTSMDFRERDFLSTADYTLDELEGLLDLASEFKSGAHDERPLIGRSVALVFFDPSLRTRTSMEIAIYELGGNPVSLDIGKGTWNLEHLDGAVMDGDKTEHIKEGPGCCPDTPRQSASGHSRGCKIMTLTLRTPSYADSRDTAMRRS